MSKGVNDTLNLWNTEQSFKVLKKKFIKYLKENNMIEGSVESSEKVKYNKFDREIDPITQECIKKMKNPRDDLKKCGKPVLGLEKVIGSLKKRWTD